MLHTAAKKSSASPPCAVDKITSPPSDGPPSVIAEENCVLQPSLGKPVPGTSNDLNSNVEKSSPLPPDSSSSSVAGSLDWTNLGVNNAVPPLFFPCDVIPLSRNDDGREINPFHTPGEIEKMEELVIVGTHGQKITRIGGLERCGSLKSLVLRSHLIPKMEGMYPYLATGNLTHLELYDNSIGALEQLGVSGNGVGGKGERSGVTTVGGALKTLDMSYNVIRDMGPVAFCPNLLELYLANNKIKTLVGLRDLKFLKKVDLGANRIRIMDGNELSGMSELEELWLGKNKIEKIEGIENLTKLRRLDVQSNRLTTIENLSSQIDTLEELYLSHNAIDDFGASSHPSSLSLPFSRLTVIDLSRNKLTSVRPFAHLSACLEDLWISGNDIRTFEDVRPLSNLNSLDTLYLEYNPLQKEFEYRKKLKEMIPSLNQIDADPVIDRTDSGGMNTVGGRDITTVAANNWRSCPQDTADFLKLKQREVLELAEKQQ